MANWLLDYMEMTEYIPVEFRDQSFSMRELDLKVSSKMSQLEDEIQEFFANIDRLTAEERKDQYDALLKKCNEASEAADNKIRLAERLYDLVEKSVRLLDQGLEKLKEDLIEGDKAYIVEDIERRSKELDQQFRESEDGQVNRQQQSHSKCAKDSRLSQARNMNMKCTNNHHHNHHRHSIPASHHSSHHHHSAKNSHHRSRNHSTSTQHTLMDQRPKKRERKRLNSAMTIFNRNSSIITDDDSTNQTFLSSPSTPDNFVGLHNSLLNDMSGGDSSCFSGKDKVSGNGIIAPDKINGSDPMLAKARQPILTAIDAALAVSPSATNSDKLILFSGHSNGENGKNSTLQRHLNMTPNLPNADTNQQSKSNNQFITNQLSHRIFSQAIDPRLGQIGRNCIGKIDQQSGPSVAPFKSNHEKNTPNILGPLPLSSSQDDEILMAASQAINATQSMTSGRRTSSLKASYAAVNSGRMKHSSSSNHTFDQTAFMGKVYCKCRGIKHDPNMIGCDNINCKIEWFHYECVGITTPPDGEWYCDDCKSSFENKKAGHNWLLGRDNDKAPGYVPPTNVNHINPSASATPKTETGTTIV